jgi:hypothetical protein
VRELGFQHITDRATVTAAAKQKGVADWEDGNEEKGKSSECVSNSMVLLCVDNLLNYMNQTGFKYNDSTASRKTCTAMTRSLSSSQKQVTYKLFLKVNVSCVRNYNVICDILCMYQTKYFRLCIFLLFIHLLAFIIPDNQQFSVSIIVLQNGQNKTLHSEQNTVNDNILICISYDAGRMTSTTCNEIWHFCVAHPCY